MDSVNGNRAVNVPAVSFQHVSRRFGSVTAVDDVTIDVAPGEFLSLVGPSGSGKTTLLMMLAGFEQPSAGRLAVSGRDVTDLAPNHRNIGMVFQKYALFPHRTVADNIAFPLRMRGIGRSEREQRVAEVLAMVKLDGYGQRMPAQLSGGQQQRVALARAIVFEPPVILMDEPLGALDKKLRQHMQIEIKELQARLKATVIYVTHDQEEALTMSDRVAILDHGKLVQSGGPRELYEAPATAFVADFLGDMNFLPAEITGMDERGIEVTVGGRRVPVATSGCWKDKGAVRLAVRPEHVTVLPGPAGQGLSGMVDRLVFQGSNLTILVSVDRVGQLRAQVEAQSPLASLATGDPVAITWAPERAHLFPRAGS
ncbi:polyamine-transporting ATPase [Agaricicola taiwanensis]|uniref:Spermidine/putrescine import ATP-binding protein PotA n=1 Tax=Agaricicola taiwanensis TaxID=591372 RepID=A0A8J2VVH3_9RHOB|nr:ABC transporter ATP-binding protein [Agaricicola taiwanensis]GGE41035.1 polyamine-transporting ATPase [Agaricicola taiwanensis]